MQRFFALLKANIKMTLRNNQSLFWMFVFPVLLMTLFGIIFSNNAAKPRLALVNEDQTKASQSIVLQIKKVKVLNVILLPDKKKAKKELEEGSFDGLLVFKKGLGNRLQAMVFKLANKPAQIDLYFDPSATSSSQVVQTTVANIFTQLEKGVLKQPSLFKINRKSVRLASLRYIDYLLPGMIAMTLMNSALFGLGGTIVNYRERGILRRLMVTPQPLSQFIAAQIGNQLIFSILRALLLIAVAVIFFQVKIVGSYWLLFLIVIIGSLTFVTVAFTVASFAKNREVADTLSNIISLPMMFLSGVFFPVDNAPAWIKPFIQVLPLKYLADAFRAVMIKGQSLAAVERSMLILLAITVVFFILSVKLWRWE